MIDPQDPVGQERGRATRREIVNVARRLFSEHGYHGTTMADIQQATGLTRGAFYHHFRGKEDVALATLDLAREDYAHQCIGPAMKLNSPAEKLTALLDKVADLNERPQWRNCCLLASLAAELTGADDRVAQAVRAMRAEIVETWRNLIAQSQSANQMDATISPAVVAEWIMSSITGSLLTRKLDPAAVDLSQILQAIRRLLLNAPPRARPVEQRERAWFLAAARASEMND